MFDRRQAPGELQLVVVIQACAHDKALLLVEAAGAKIFDVQVSAELPDTGRQFGDQAVVERLGQRIPVLDGSEMWPTQPGAAKLQVELGPQAARQATFLPGQDVDQFTGLLHAGELLSQRFYRLASPGMQAVRIGTLPVGDYEVGQGGQVAMISNTQSS